jgi:hypothetical protein
MMKSSHLPAISGAGASDIQDKKRKSHRNFFCLLFGNLLYLGFQNLHPFKRFLQRLVQEGEECECLGILDVATSGHGAKFGA